VERFKVRSGSFDAILFDNDGVLVDTEGLYFRANREVLAGVGVTLDEAGYSELFLKSGRGAWHLAEERGHGAESIASLRSARDRRYAELVATTDVLVPGVVELVRALAASYRLAIVTSSDPGPFALTHARTGLLGFFELVLTREHYRNSKPDPEPYLHAVARLGAARERCLVVEDSERGLQAAKAAGLTCWVVPSGLTAGGRFGEADAVLPHLGAVAERLLADPFEGSE
jgi:HAD superfamily hydrolase (TIGR01509 family)